MERILHDDWSVRLGENRSDQPFKHLADMLCNALFDVYLEALSILQHCELYSMTLRISVIKWGAIISNEVKNDKYDKNIRIHKTGAI